MKEVYSISDKNVHPSSSKRGMNAKDGNKAETPSRKNQIRTSVIKKESRLDKFGTGTPSRKSVIKTTGGY